MKIRKNQLDIYFLTVWDHSQAQKCLKINPKPFC